MKLFLFFFFTFNAFGQSPFEKEMSTFVDRLNGIFLIKAKLITDCDDVEPSIEPGKDIIKICRPVLDYFTSLNDVKSLLTFISHEYAHILVTERISATGWNIRKKSVNEAANFIKAQMTPEMEKKFIVLTSRFGSRPIEWFIKFFLETYEHENMDTLGVKLMLMAGLSPNANSVGLWFRKFAPQDEFVIFARENAISDAHLDGLSRWTNFRCIGAGLDEQETAIELKASLPESLISTFIQPCTDEEIFQNFTQALEVYF